jgi:hypothetical protein
MFTSNYNELKTIQTKLMNSVAALEDVSAGAGGEAAAARGRAGGTARRRDRGAMHGGRPAAAAPGRGW